VESVQFAKTSVILAQFSTKELLTAENAKKRPIAALETCRIFDVRETSWTLPTRLRLIVRDKIWKAR
jgi:hypothetical protein